MELVKSKLITNWTNSDINICEIGNTCVRKWKCGDNDCVEIYLDSTGVIELQKWRNRGHGCGIIKLDVARVNVLDKQTGYTFN